MAEQHITCVFHHIAMLPGHWTAPSLLHPGRWAVIYGRECPVADCNYHVANGHEDLISEGEAARRGLASLAWRVEGTQDGIEAATATERVYGQDPSSESNRGRPASDRSQAEAARRPDAHV